MDLPHRLISVKKGISRQQRGEYLCSCGYKATGKVLYKVHQSEGNRKYRQTLVEQRDNANGESA